MKKISKFSREFSFLSNFYPSTIIYKGHIYRTVEHAYQAAKTNDEKLKTKIRMAETPGQAKKLGKKVKIVDNWDHIKIKVMAELLILKFNNTKLKDQLMKTKKFYLEEGNWWGDTFWGVCNGQGQNILGLLLMFLRDLYFDESKGGKHGRK